MAIITIIRIYMFALILLGLPCGLYANQPATLDNEPASSSAANRNIESLSDLHSNLSIPSSALYQNASSSIINSSSSNAPGEYLQVIFLAPSNASEPNAPQPKLLIFPVSNWEDFIARSAPKSQAPIFENLEAVLQTPLMPQNNNTRGEGNESTAALQNIHHAYQARVQAKYIDFYSGSGTRFVHLNRPDLKGNITGNADKDSRAIPLYYSFQGISSDKNFYLFLTWPLSLNKGTLLQDSEIIPFLKKSSEFDFTPKLSQLDSLVQSIKIVQPD